MTGTVDEKTGSMMRQKQSRKPMFSWMSSRQSASKYYPEKPAMEVASSSYKPTHFISETLQKTAIVQDYFRKWNAHDWRGISFNLLTRDFVMVEIGKDTAYEMPWNELAEEGQKIHDSFPDYKVTYEAIILREGAVTKKLESMSHHQKYCDNEDRVFVVTHNVKGSGTHTGRPYAFVSCDAIPTSGKLVKTDREHMHFYFRAGKICRVEVYSKDGALTGPAGIYTQLGGFPMV